MYDRLYAYQGKYRENRENLIREEEQRYSQTKAQSSQSVYHERSRRTTERRRAAYDSESADGCDTQTPSQLFSTVQNVTTERQAFTPSVNARSTEIVRQRQERALQMVDAPDSHRSSTGNQVTPRMYGGSTWKTALLDRKHEKSKEEWNKMLGQFQHDFSK